MKHKPFTRILSLLLAVATLASLLTFPASAATLNTSGSVTIQYLGRKEYLSKSTSGSLSGSSWTYTSNDGLTGTAYCVNWGLAAVSPSKPRLRTDLSLTPKARPFRSKRAKRYPSRSKISRKGLSSSKNVTV